MLILSIIRCQIHQNCGNVEYYTVTGENGNNKVDIKFESKTFENKEYDYLAVNVANAELPEDVYDIVIDAGHGGTDSGEKSGKDTEADITLSYANLLKEKLEVQGLKVKMTRTNANTGAYTSTNMYDENGRITTACKSKAKLMISLHINNGNAGLKRLRDIFSMQI